MDNELAVVLCIQPPLPAHSKPSQYAISSTRHFLRMGSTVKPHGAATTGVDDEEAFLLAMQLIRMADVPRILRATIQLGLLEVISEGGKPMSAAEIVSHIPARNPGAAAMVDRMLSLLASYDLVTCSLRELGSGKAERLYGLTPACKLLMKDEHGVSLASLSYLDWEVPFVQSWYHIGEAVLEGGVAFSKAHGGKTPFEYMPGDLKLRELFNQGMSDHSFTITKKMLETYNGFEGLRTVVDVGGGTGATLNVIVTRYPNIKGINFDLPHVIAEAPPHPGVEHVGGDMFVSVPKGDAIFMKWISHNWGDEPFMKILKNCYEALPENGKVILADYVLPPLPDTSMDSKMASHFDCLMLAHFPGGKERTVEELKELAMAAGFKGFRFGAKVYGVKIMELLKKA